MAALLPVSLSNVDYQKDKGIINYEIPPKKKKKSELKN
jgi:hypothetical protein